MDYEVVFSNRRTIALSVKRGELIVRAPYRTSKDKIEKLISEHKNWIETHIEKQREKQEKFINIDETEKAELKKNAKTILPVKVQYYANCMGLKYGRITITSAKTRLGSCSSKGNISFSYRLMLYPDKAIDYVVVHELAHLLEMNHSKRFYSIIEQVLPDYKKRKKLLK